MKSTVITPNDFTGSDAQRINAALAAAAGHRVVIPPLNGRGSHRSKVWRLDEALRLPGNTTLELDNCHIQLSDRCRDNFMRSANCGVGIAAIAPLRNIHIHGSGKVVLEGADRPRATGDSAKIIGQQTFGTDAGVAGENQSGDWRNIGILLAFVEDFSIQNLTIKDSHCWAISLERCAHGRVSEIKFQSTQTKSIAGVKQTILNQDGLDLRQGCHDIVIENLTGYTGDDLVALTAIPLPVHVAGSFESSMITNPANRGRGVDDIHHVTLRNIQGSSRGGHHLVRLLNAGGFRIHHILLEGLRDTSARGVRAKAAVKIGDANPVWGGVPPLGDTSHITIRGVVSRAQHAILIAGSLTDSTIENVTQLGANSELITVESGPQNLRNVTS